MNGALGAKARASCRRRAFGLSGDCSVEIRVAIGGYVVERRASAATERQLQNDLLAPGGSGERTQNRERRGFNGVRSDREPVTWCSDRKCGVRHLSRNSKWHQIAAREVVHDQPGYRGVMVRVGADEVANPSG